MGCMKLTLQNNKYKLVFLLLSSFILFMSQFTAQGRQFPKVPGANMIKGGVNMRLLIGSRPPRCDQRCHSCGHCEAIQVPIATSSKTKFLNQHQITIMPFSRGDDISNYKPMSWKCKCGDFIFNP